MITKEILIDKINVVVENLMNMGGADYENDKKLSLEEIVRTGNCNRDFGIEEWDWPQGVGLYGIMKLEEYYRDDRYMEFFIKWYERNIEFGLPSRNINTTAPYLTLLSILDKMPEKEKYETMCLEQARWLVEELPKTKENGFQHVTTGIGDRNVVILNESQLWLDTIFMTLLFLYKMGVRYNNTLWKETAEYQVLLHIKYLFDKQSGFFYHGWSFERNDNFGGVFWCRGNSWFTLSIMEFIRINPEMNNGLKEYFLSTFIAQVIALQASQGSDGLWHTVLVDKESYTEASGSAAFLAGIMNALRNGVLSDEYLPMANNALAALLECIQEDGSVNKVSAGTAMGYDADHYKQIQLKPMAYGQALTLLALIESL